MDNHIWKCLNLSFLGYPVHIHVAHKYAFVNLFKGVVWYQLGFGWPVMTDVTLDIDWWYWWFVTLSDNVYMYTHTCDNMCLTQICFCKVFKKVLFGISGVGVDLWWLMWHWWQHHRLLHHTIATQNQTIVSLYLIIFVFIFHHICVYIKKIFVFILENICVYISTSSPAPSHDSNPEPNHCQFIFDNICVYISSYLCLY